jgi:hypothetical protein
MRTYLAAGDAFGEFLGSKANKANKSLIFYRQYSRFGVSFSRLGDQL